ncbi:MAG TPA: gluconate 2-dehydrogenase subunit 3 family protein [Mycobacteriales bacterium]|nr:gluconate 2-dehydrogenase subunit 3 family protein [Mycobacteriales bacterium]
MRRRTGVTPGGQGRFEGYDVLSQVSTWDEVTAGVVLRRLGPPQPLRFFGPAEEAVAGALVDHLLDQWDEPKVPVLAMIDQRLTEGSTDGWHHADMPADGEAWRRTLSFLDGDATDRHGRGFAVLARAHQAAIVQEVQDRPDDWHGLPAKHVWSLWTRYACTAFYAHPWAWNEIGFGGPAYPRGYKNVGLDRREPWERSERGARDPIPAVRQSTEARRRRAEAGR